MIPIPLTPDVSAAHIDLQAVLDRTYEVGLYARRTRYDRPPDPPLTPEHQAWAEGVLRGTGLLT